MKRIPKWWFAASLILSFLGFLDSSYLAAKHYIGFQVNCSLLNGCEQVLNSVYAVVLGIPIALVGVFYYLCIFFALILFLDRKKFFFLKVAVVLPVTGFFFTVWLLITQIFLIEAFCLYCIVSAGLTTGLFTLSVYLIFSGNAGLYIKKQDES